GIDNFLNLDHRDLARHGDIGIEVACGTAKQQVACAVGLPCLDQRDIRHQRTFHDISFAIEFAQFLAVRNDGAYTCLGEECRNARPTGAELFSQRTLRGEFQFQLTRQELAFELFVLAHVGGDHLADLTGFEQLSQTKAVDTSIVADAGQVLYACIPQCGDERLGNAAEAEATHSDHLAIGHDAFQCFVGTCINFIHYTLPCAKQRNVDETLNAAYRASPDYASCASCSREEHTCHALEFGLRPGRRTTRGGVDAHHDGRSSRAWSLFALYGDFDRTFQAGSTHPNQSSIDHHRGGPQNGTQKIAGDACQNDITPGVCTRQATGCCIVHARLFHVS